MLKRLMRHKRLGAFSAIVALAAAGAAFAYWTGGGSGSGQVEVGTVSTVVLTGIIAADQLAPGTEIPVAFTAANSDTSPIFVTTVHLDGVTVDAGHAACETDDFTMVDEAEGHDVPAGATAEALPNDGTLVYANTAVNQDACQGAILTLALSSV